jgi:hypothetical protein
MFLVKRNGYTADGRLISHGRILMLPELLVCPCALSVMLQVPTEVLSGSLKITCINGKFGTGRTSSAAIS